MPTFIVNARNTGPVTELTITADSKEAAIDQVVRQAQPGEQMEVMSVVEVPAEAAPASKKQGKAE